MQYLATTAEGLNGSLFGAYPFPPFKFQPRSESVDWRRISALDMDRVVRELDVATLQENIIHVTFCSLDQEVCHRCRQPLDPAVLKLLHLAQLTIQYLLHCQNCLSTSITQLEARLQASLSQQEKGRQELERQTQEFKGVKEESRQRRKMIRTLQQLLLQTGVHNYHPCHLCDKAFMNVTFLQGHMQRRHLNMAEGVKQKKPEWLLGEDVLEELRAKLKWTQEELEAQREAEKRRQLQEAEVSHQKEIETKKKFDEWKEKERASLYEEIDKFKKSLWDEFKSVANHNSMLEEKLKMLQSQSHSMMESSIIFRLDESGEHFKQNQEIRALKEKMDIEEKLRQTQEFEVLKEKTDIQKLKMLQSQSHSMMESNLRLLLDKSQLQVKQSQELQALKEKMDIQLQEQKEKLQAYMFEDQQKAAAQSQQQISALQAQLQKYASSIASQKQMIRTMSLRKEEGTCKGPKAVEPEDSSSEEIVTSALRKKAKKQGSKQKGVCDLKNSRGGQQKVLASLRPDPTLLKFRSMLEKTLEKKLESMGITKNKKGISLKTLQHLEPFLRFQRVQMTQKFSEFLSLRVKFDKEVTSRAKKRQKKDRTLRFQLDTKAPVERQRGPKAIKEAQPKPKTLPVSLPSMRAEVPMETRQSLEGHGPGLAQVPAPILHQSAHGPFGSPASLRPGLSTLRFNLEEDSKGNSEQRTFLQPLQDPFRKRPQARVGWECSDIKTLEESPQSPDQSSVKRQRGRKAIKEAQPKPKTLPVSLPSMRAEVPMETRQSLEGHGPGLAQVPAPILHQSAHGPFGSPASLRPGLSTLRFNLEEDSKGNSEQRTFLQPLQDPFRKRPQARVGWECSDIKTLEESPQSPDQSSVERQRGRKAIKEAQPKPKTLPVSLPSMRAEVPMETRQSLEGHGPGLAQVPAPILHQSAHGPFGSPASLRPGLSTPPFSLEEDSKGNSEQRTFLQPLQDPFRKRPQARVGWECSDIKTLEESPQSPDQSSVERQRGRKAIKEAQPKPKTLPVSLPSMRAEVPMETRQSLEGHGPGLAQVPAPILHQSAHGPFGSPASLRPGLSTPPFSLEEDSEGNSEQRTFVQPLQDPFRKRPQVRVGWECTEIETLEESPQHPDQSSVERQRGRKAIKEAQPKPKTLPVSLPSMRAEVPMETRQSLEGHGPGLAQVPAPILHQSAHGPFGSPASLRPGLSTPPFSLEEDSEGNSEQRTFVQPLQDPFRKRPQVRVGWECTEIETLEESPQHPDQSSVERQRGPKAIKEAQPKPKTLPVSLPSMRAEVPMETRQSLEGHGPGLAQVPAPILHQSAHGPFGSPASLRPGLSTPPFSLEEDSEGNSEQRTFLQPLQDPFRKRPQVRVGWECTEIETLEESPQHPDQSSVERQRGRKAIKEAQPKPKTLPVSLPSMRAEVPMETRQSLEGHGPGLAQVPAPILHQSAHGPFGSPASLRPGLSTPPFSLEEDSEGNSEQRTFLQPLQDPFRKRPQVRVGWECTEIETLEESPQHPDQSSVERQRGPKAIKEAQPKPKTLPVSLPSMRAEVPMETRQSLEGHGPGLAQVPAPILHQSAHGPFGSPASLRPGLSTPPFSLEEDSEGNSEQRTFLQPLQDPFRKRPQVRVGWECTEIETLEESPQHPDQSSERQRGPKAIKEAQPKPKTLPVSLPSMRAEVPMETRQSLEGHGPGLAQVPAPILHQSAHGPFGSPASLRPGLSTPPFSLEEDSEGNSEQRTFVQPLQDPFRKRPQVRVGWECTEIETLEESPQHPDQSSVERQRGPKAIKEAQPKPKTLPVSLPSMRAEVPMETRQSLEGHGPGLAQVPAPILHQSAHGPFGSPASLRPGLSTPPFSLEEDSKGNSEQRTFLQPLQDPFRKRPQARVGWECTEIETLEESPQHPDQSSETLVQSLVKNFEQELEFPVKKPDGGIKLFLKSKGGPQRSAVSGTKSQLSDDESDLSSLIEFFKTRGQKEQMKPLEMFSTSPWSPM
uniref:cilium assembly protein DZIP1L isoform X9 n=1 Tax=Nyctereutes procyonoides TaxID=34880 RepID=UPI0024451F3E|nr:cilium assembly protein DZIP1L isoform X9 [Nyctereutes procyonoides]